VPDAVHSLEGRAIAPITRGLSRAGEISPLVSKPICQWQAGLDAMIPPRRGRSNTVAAVSRPFDLSE
jgi:hypothetical protein